MLNFQTQGTVIRDATQADWPEILALNAEFVFHMSPMDMARLAQMARASCYLRVFERDGFVAGFLIGFRKGAAYDGEIFRLFDRRDDDFIYLDRVAVASWDQHHGVAGKLYDDVVSFARASGVNTILCEVDVDPPNPVSLHFHERRGFREIGRQKADVRDRVVALLALQL
ncbi:MAG: GNAT family N-acetyltransferase [Rhizomicrobium sp.]|jgi:predicted GNAT superfamily acetyltransferase